jgi:hypothetical protein
MDHRRNTAGTGAGVMKAIHGVPMERHGEMGTLFSFSIQLDPDEWCLCWAVWMVGCKYNEQHGHDPKLSMIGAFIDTALADWPIEMARGHDHDQFVERMKARDRANLVERLTTCISEAINIGRMRIPQGAA